MTAARAVIAGLLLTAAVAVAFETGPVLEPRQHLPDDVAELTESTWRLFRSAFPAQAGCLVDVELELVREIEAGAAEYIVAERLIRIEIPTSPRRYVESLTHELAHHIDAVCHGERTIGAAFRSAQGIGLDVPWESAASWEERPMEQFAETIVEYVTGDRYSHADVIDVSEEALTLVRVWATGSA